MPSKGFEPAIPAVKRAPTYALDRTDIGIGLILTLRILKLSILFQNWVRTSQKKNTLYHHYMEKWCTDA